MNSSNQFVKSVTSELTSNGATENYREFSSSTTVLKHYRMILVPNSFETLSDKPHKIIERQRRSRTAPMIQHGNVEILGRYALLVFLRVTDGNNSFVRIV